jgi:multiple sugar transport system substrate-binding protein
MADYVVVDMVAEAASGAKTVQQAIDRAADRAKRFYKA